MALNKLSLEFQALLNLMCYTEKASDLCHNNLLVSLVSLLPYVQVILFTVCNIWIFVFTSLIPFINPSPQCFWFSWISKLYPSFKVQQSLHVLQEIFQLSPFLLNTAFAKIDSYTLKLFNLCLSNSPTNLWTPRTKTKSYTSLKFTVP